MASITTWLRLESAVTREQDLDADAGREAEARMQDPLWLLYRQWQFGEFQATDAGSPVMVQPTVRSAPVTRFAPDLLRPGKKVKGEKFDVASDLLEARVEAERGKVGPLASRLDVEAGQELRMTLSEAGFAKYARAVAEAFPVSLARKPEEADDHRADLIEGHVIDGRAALRAMAKAARPSSMVSVSPAPSAAERKRLDGLLESWADWAQSWLETPTHEAWAQEWLEYRFSLGIAGNQALTTPGYRSEPSWFAFDAVQGGRLGATEPVKESVWPAMLPSLVRYPGMASSRFWEFENEEVRLVQLIERGSVLAASVLDFVLLGGDDWFQLPVELPTGQVHTITRLQVIDTFGEAHDLPALGDYRGERRFALWRLSGSAEPALFLPPPAGSRLESAPIERVELFSDEASNLFWAVEELVEGFSAPLDRARRWPAQEPDVTATPGKPDLEYRLVQSAPPGYFPMFAEGKVGSEKLVPGEVLRTDGGDVTADARVLLDGPILAAVVPTGVGVDRSFQWARRPDGRMALWVGRSRRSGSPPPSPRVGFDALVPAIRPAPADGTPP